MFKKHNSNAARIKRHGRLRRKIIGTSKRPRLNVFRSLSNIYAQVIDDERGITIAAASSLEGELKGKYGGNKAVAREVGGLIAKKAREKGVTTVVFDRGGFLYHGRVAELAEGAREGGLIF